MGIVDVMYVLVINRNLKLIAFTGIFYYKQGEKEWVERRFLRNNTWIGSIGS